MADVDMSYASDASFVMDSDDDGSDFEFVENVAPKAKKSTKAKAAPKKTAGAAKKAAPKTKKAAASSKSKKAALDSLTNLDSDDDDDMSIEDVAAPPSKAKSKKVEEKSIEQMYQKKTQLEHILLRPDTYIGSTEPTTQPMFVLHSETGRIVERTVTYTPGLYKIFDEILVNAADNKQRDPNMDRMDVTIDPEANAISVKNNGKGIPVEMHKEHKVSLSSIAQQRSDRYDCIVWQCMDCIVGSDLTLMRCGFGIVCHCTLYYYICASPSPFHRYNIRSLDFFSFSATNQRSTSPRSSLVSS